MKSVAPYLIYILSVIAATELIIHENNGSQHVIPIDDIQSITFDTSTNPDSPNLVINKNDDSEDVLPLEGIQRITFSSYYNIYKVYIAYQGSEKVGVINGETGELIKEINVNISGMDDNPHYIVIDEVNKYWYVTLLMSGYVLKYDLITDELVSSIQVGNMPALMEIDPVNQYLYVSRFMPMGGMETSSTFVHRIHTETLEKDSVNVGASSPHGIALSSDGSTLWVASNQSSHFFRIETSRFDEEGYQPENFKIDPSVQPSYEFNDGIYEPLELVLSPDGEKLYISCSDMMINEIRSFSTETGELLNIYELGMDGMQPWHIVIDPNENILYSASRMGNSVSVIDLETETGDITYIQDDQFNMPHGIGISGDGSRVFVSSSAMMDGGTSYLHIINTSTNALIGSFNLGDNVIATGMAVMQNIPSNEEVTFSIDDFESATQCQQCHTNHYREWSGSMHAYALKDPVWFSLHSQEQAHFQENDDIELGQFCIMCHSPVAFLTNAIPDPASLTFESSVSFPAQVREGITCSVCHAVVHASPTTSVDTNEGTFDAIEYFLHTDSISHIKYGSIEDPFESPYHQLEFNQLYRKSEYCMGCHNLSINDIGVEMTFDEWAGSPYQAMGFECQTCHMQSYSGYAVDTMIVPDAPFRNNLHRHNFAGIDQALTEFEEEEAQAEAIYQLLSTAADIDFVSNIPETIESGDTITFQIGVANNAGHNLPSGVTFSRQLWLEITATSESNILYKSGHLNENKDLFDFYIDPSNQEDPDLTIFNTVLYNAEGDSGLRNVSVERMAYMSDYTIPTSGSKIVTYEIPVPENASDTINISARLRFRALPPFYLRELVPGADESKLTIFNLDSTFIEISVIQNN